MFKSINRTYFIYDVGCIHPLCKQNVRLSIEEYKWYTNGPPVNKLLLPVADPDV